MSTTITNFPVVCVPVDPYAMTFRMCASASFFPVSDGKTCSSDQLLARLPVDLNWGEADTSAHMIIANTLSAPLVQSGYYLEEGEHTFEPAVMQLPIDAPDTLVALSTKTIPGRVEAMIPDTSAGDGVYYDTPTFGVGLHKVIKTSWVYGCGCAITFTCEDERLGGKEIGVAAYTGNGSGHYFACTLDISKYGSAKGFHDATVGAKAANINAVKTDDKGVYMFASAQDGQLHTTNWAFGAGNVAQAIYTFYIGATEDDINDFGFGG